MVPEDVDRVRQIVKDELWPALEEVKKEIEARMTAHVTAFQQQIRTDVEHHHGENRVRLQLIDDKAREAAEQAQMAAHDAAKAVAGNDYIVDRLSQQDARGEKTQSLVLELLAKVNRQTGHNEGIAEAEAEQDVRSGKRMGVAKWVGGILASGGAGKWLWSHFHWFGGGK